mgnify:CR=1 FL=1
MRNDADASCLQDFLLEFLQGLLAKFLAGFPDDRDPGSFAREPRRGASQGSLAREPRNKGGVFAGNRFGRR